MKKNNMLRIASVLLVAVLLSTCAVAGAFANYATDITTNDSAVVAKWGVKIADNGADMFGDAYGAGDAIVSYVANETDDTLTVQADTAGKKIVAPGTKGALAALTITGTPEVDVDVTYDAELTLTGWDIPDTATNDPADTIEYCPIVITVNTVPYYMGATVPTEILADGKIDSVADFETAVEAAIEAKAARYHTNTNLSAEDGAANVADDVQVSWAWAYNTDVANDTALGDQAADGSAANIALTVKTTITQAD